MMIRRLTSTVGSFARRRPFRLGKAIIHRISETDIDLPLSILGLDGEGARAGAALLPVGVMKADSTQLRKNLHSWLIEHDGRIVLIDPGNGNDRQRPGYPALAGLDTRWLEQLCSTGIDPKQVDLVLSTHLHCDHCGWNTRWNDDHWVPTFPTARYVFHRREVDRWAAPGRFPKMKGNVHNRYIFAESVEPIIAAGLADLVDLPYEPIPGLQLIAAPGHTSGHMSIRLESEGHVAWFTGDIFHHPLQIVMPELELPGSDDPDLAIATREEMLARITAEKALAFPAHFAGPYQGRIVADARCGYSFMPA